MTSGVDEVMTSHPASCSYNLVNRFVDQHLAHGLNEKDALRCQDRCWTYEDVANRTNQLARVLVELGVDAEQRVLILLPDIPEFAAAFFGSIKIGAIAVPTNTALRPSDYAYFLDESRARVLITHDSLWPQVESIVSDRPWLRHLITVGEAPPGAIRWRDVIKADDSHFNPVATGPDDAAFWLWTSGSTGLPKAAVHLQHDWEYCCENYAVKILGLSRDDRVFSSSKLFHAYGLGNGLMFPFYAGATAVLFPGRPLPQAILQTAEEAEPTLFFSVPTLYNAMLKETDVDNPYSLSTVRLAVSAAEPLPAETYRRWKERFGAEILDGIGSTEVLHIYASARPGRVKPGSTGQAVPGYELRIADEDGRPVSEGEIGDLWVKGDSTAAFYWNRHQLSKERMQGEWFLSGDKYFQDEDGYLFYAGRADDMFRVSGQWVSPIEVENTLIEHPAVLESAVVPLQNSEGLTKPKAYVVLKDGVAVSDELVTELQEFVRSHITPYKYPRMVEFVQDLPKTAAGKIQRFKLR